jgi:hypothetical protein
MARLGLLGLPVLLLGLLAPGAMAGQGPDGKVEIDRVEPVYLYLVLLLNAAHWMRVGTTKSSRMSGREDDIWADKMLQNKMGTKITSHCHDPAKAKGQWFSEVQKR